MVEQTQSVGGSGDSVCPWCSATYAGDPDTCPSCGAALAVDPATDPSLPGLTAIDTAAIVRSRVPVAKPRSRLLSWLSGEYTDDVPSAADSGALAPPDADVRREMLRLELEAEVANLQAEAEALIAEATVEGRVPGAARETAAAATIVVDELEAVATDLDAIDETIDTDPVGSDRGRPA